MGGRNCHGPYWNLNTVEASSWAYQEMAFQEFGDSAAERVPTSLLPLTPFPCLVSPSLASKLLAPPTLTLRPAGNGKDQGVVQGSPRPSRRGASLGALALRSFSSAPTSWNNHILLPSPQKPTKTTVRTGEDGGSWH